MEVFWAVFASIVLMMIIIGLAKSSMDSRKKKRLASRYLPEVDQYVRVGERYDLTLSNGDKFINVAIIGYSKFHDSLISPNTFPDGQWLILERSDSRRVFVRPQAIRYFEQATTTN